jgi:heavy metal-binding protein
VTVAAALLLVLAQFWCPMHPDERAATRGTCGICGMALVPMPPARFATYPVDLRVTPTLTGARLRLAVTNPATGAIVRKLSIVHERPLHLFVIGEGLEFFTHDHPAQQPDGVFMLDVRLPRPGPYMAIAEFLPEGGTPQTFQQVFTTGEAFARPVMPAVDLDPKIAGGVRVTLDASKLRAGDDKALTIRVDDAVSGAPIEDLEPYLGASAHLLIVPVDLTEAIHGHPVQEARGPAMAFAPLLPRAGRYKAWIQFQRAGRVSTVAFVIDVP